MKTPYGTHLFYISISLLLMFLAGAMAGLPDNLLPVDWMGWKINDVLATVFGIAAILFYMPEYYWAFLVADFFMYCLVKGAGYVLTLIVFEWVF